MLTNGKYAVYTVSPQESGDQKRTLASVFAMKDGNFHLLEDYNHLFSRYNPEDGKPMKPEIERRMGQLLHSPYVKIIPTIEDGEASHVKDAKLPVAPKDIYSKGQTFIYEPMGGQPVHLTFERNYFTLNGYPISHEELEHINKEVQEGNAFIKYPENLHKAEEKKVQRYREDDVDTEMDLDYMCPDIFNAHAYRKFVASEPKGINIFLKTDSIKDTLDSDGEDIHDTFLKQVGMALHEASSVEEKQGKVFHLSHESYFVFMPDYESALRFLRNLDAETNNISVVGSHAPHFDIGVSDTLEGAFDALNQVEGFKLVNGMEGSHIVINTDHTFRYVSPAEF